MTPLHNRWTTVSTLTHAGKQLPGDRGCSFLLAKLPRVFERRCSQCAVLALYVCVCGCAGGPPCSLSLWCFLSTLLHHSRELNFPRSSTGIPKESVFVGHLATHHTAACLPFIYHLFLVGGWNLQKAADGDQRTIKRVASGVAGRRECLIDQRHKATALGLV